MLDIFAKIFFTRTGRAVYRSLESRINWKLMPKTEGYYQSFLKSGTSFYFYGLDDGLFGLRSNGFKMNWFEQFFMYYLVQSIIDSMTADEVSGVKDFLKKSNKKREA